MSLVLLYSTINGRAKCTVLFRGVSPSVTRLECILYVEVQTPITPLLLLGGFEPELPTPQLRKSEIFVCGVKWNHENRAKIELGIC